MTVDVNMLDLKASRRQMHCYQNRPVTFQRFFFRTHQGDLKVVFDPANHALKAMLEQFGFREAIVLYFAAFIAVGIVARRRVPYLGNVRNATLLQSGF